MCDSCEKFFDAVDECRRKHPRQTVVCMKLVAAAGWCVFGSLCPDQGIYGLLCGWHASALTAEPQGACGFPTQYPAWSRAAKRPALQLTCEQVLHPTYHPHAMSRSVLSCSWASFADVATVILRFTCHEICFLMSCRCYNSKLA